MDDNVERLARLRYVKKSPIAQETLLTCCKGSPENKPAPERLYIGRVYGHK